MSEWRLVKVGKTAPRNGGHGSWVETDHPAVVACMGSVPACAKNGCQYRVLREALEAERDALLAEVNDLLGMLDAKAQLDGGFKGMGVNISIEHAARIPAQVSRIRKLLAQKGGK